MKRKSLVILFSLAIIFSSCSIFQGGGGKDFEGKITYKITYPGSDLEPAQQAQLPKQTEVYVKGNYKKEVMNQGMAEIVQITDGSAKTKTILIAGGGMKKYITQDAAKIEAQNSELEIIDIKKTEETKEIAGYDTKKVIASYKNEYDETEEFVMYYTPEIGNKAMNFDNPFMKEVDGLVLQYEMSQNNMTMKYTAENVEKMRLKETDFLVPADYEKFTEEELQQMGE
ncbi:MAG: hypothetical protein ACQESZ_07835 [Bacteroidota bacterium]